MVLWILRFEWADAVTTGSVRRRTVTVVLLYSFFRTLPLHGLERMKETAKAPFTIKVALPLCLQVHHVHQALSHI